ncbi:MAG TPA: sulfotransferase domain-containing protein [Mycobacteriales bacterium]|nr:sulfotransferase domain-containing protein [Mycobacteriales bacterium]
MPVRYTSDDEDSARWDGFPFRTGDIVISTRSKSGTTWVQLICLLLVLQTDALTEPLANLSPWLDRTTDPLDGVIDRLDRQTHRRVIKTHTPLDGIPIDRRATYIVVGRHPLDMAVSLYHQGANIDRRRLRELTGQPEPTDPPKPRLDVHSWLLRWIERNTPPAEWLDDLPGVLWHIKDAWTRRDANNIVLVHYDDLLGDLEAQIRALAHTLSIEITSDRVSQLARAATFDSMRANHASLVPDHNGILKDSRAFFRQGHSGSGADVLTTDELAHYYDRASSLAPADALRWLHRT